MAHISAHMSHPQSGKSESPQNCLATEQKQTRRAVALIWSVMTELTGARWCREFGDVGGSAFDRWCDVLSGLSEDDLKRGLEALPQRPPEKLAFLPNAFEFLAMCRGTDSELADVEAELLHWIRNGGYVNWKSDLAFTVSLVIGQSDLRGMNHREIRAKLPGAIREAKQDLKLRPAPVPRQQQIPRHVGPKQTEKSRQYIAEMKSKLASVPSSTPTTGHQVKSWELPSTCQRMGCDAPLPKGWQYVHCPECHDEVPASDEVPA